MSTKPKTETDVATAHVEAAALDMENLAHAGEFSPATHHPVAVITPASEVMDLIRTAVSANVGQEQLNSLIKLKRSYEAEEHRRAFFAAFSRFQRRMVDVQIPRNGIGKVKTDKAEFEYRYALYDDIMKAVLPELTAEGMSVAHQLRDQTDSGIWIDCIVRHELGHFEITPIWMPIEKSKMSGKQVIGSSVSYGERYSIEAALGLSSGNAAGVDPDRLPPEAQTHAPSGRQRPQKSAGRGKVNPSALKTIRKQAENKGITEKEVCAKFEIPDITQLSMSQVNSVLDWIADPS